MRTLSVEQRERLEKLTNRPEDEINFSDIPEITEFSSEATFGKFYRPVKEKVTMRLDSDVVAWLKSQGAGYQTRVNKILRNLMIRSEGGVTASPNAEKLIKGRKVLKVPKIRKASGRVPDGSVPDKA